MFDRINELLQERGIKQVTLAEGIGVSTGNISDWKSGRASPSIDALCKIAEYFNVSMDYLTGRTDVKSTADLIDLYNIGVMRWINDRAFTPEERERLRGHFYELLLRYKIVINKLANSMYSDNRKLLVASEASCEELSYSTSDTVRQYLRDLIRWIAAFPYEFNKQAKLENGEAADLLKVLAAMVGVVPDGANLDSLQLTEDERDLLDMWHELDKDGRRLLMGTAVEQKQRVMHETGKKNEQAV